MKKIRHATERERGLASQTGGCRKRFQSFFFFWKRKMWNDAGRVFGLLFAGGRSLTKFIFGGCGGTPKERAAEDNAASRRSRSGLNRGMGCGPHNQKKNMQPPRRLHGQLRSLKLFGPPYFPNAVKSPPSEPRDSGPRCRGRRSSCRTAPRTCMRRRRGRICGRSPRRSRGPSR